MNGCGFIVLIVGLLLIFSPGVVLGIFLTLIGLSIITRL